MSRNEEPLFNSYLICLTTVFASSSAFVAAIKIGLLSVAALAAVSGEYCGWIVLAMESMEGMER